VAPELDLEDWVDRGQGGSERLPCQLASSLLELGLGTAWRAVALLLLLLGQQVTVCQTSRMLCSSLPGCQRDTERSQEAPIPWGMSRL
jgi:hypothetical protein